ncbi:MAG: hypothetical protein MR270_02890 [Erysipelotrichaceae bacterium]|nr:hypothetical protein [Erysipelotrichaceae bacterium]
MAKENVEKKYYRAIKQTIAPVNENNRFHKEITNAILSGKQEIYQKRIKETQTFDSLWIETIEKYLSNIDNIIRHPRMFMEGREDVVRIERAKKITSRTIAHLSAHTENVETIQDNGVVVPNKLLTLTYEDNLAIYENRFVVTLISKLAAFIEIRYEAIKDSIITYQIDRLNVASSFKWRNYDVSCNVDIKLKQEVDDELNRKNKELFARINTIRMYVRGFMNSEFYKTIKEKAAFVVAPILRTNIILKQIDYNACLQLWQFMDSYRQLGFNVDVNEKNLDFDSDYEKALVDMIVYDYVTLAYNQETREKSYHLKPYKYHSIKNPKVVNSITNEYMLDGSSTMEAPSSNEFFYQKTIDQMSDRCEELINSGKSVKQALTTIYKQMQGITNSTYKDLIKKLKVEVDSDASYHERRKAKYQYTKNKYNIIKSIAYLKQVEADNTLKEVERLEAQLEKYQKEELAYQEELKQMRKEALKKAREARKNLPLTDKEKELKEEKKARRLAAMQAGKDKARFERKQKEEEERLEKEALERQLAKEKEDLAKQVEEQIRLEKIEALRKIEEEKKQIIIDKLDEVMENPRIYINKDVYLSSDNNDNQVVMRLFKEKKEDQEVLVPIINEDNKQENENIIEDNDVKETISEEIIKPEETKQKDTSSLKGLFNKLFKSKQR